MPRRPPPTDFDFEHLKPQVQQPRPVELKIPAAPAPASAPAPDPIVSPAPPSKPASQPVTERTSKTSEHVDPELPSSIRSKTSPVTESLSKFIDRAQTTLFTASQRINELTGYTGIETLKDRITTLENSLETAQTHLHDTRLKYKVSVSERAATQREVTTLLARQKTWTPIDFERFTTLYRQDHELEMSVADNGNALEEAERETERLNRELSTGILARYHEEQIWSDKIRRMSTWGTWGLMAVNIFLFLVLQFGAEPWRRRRLVKGFEEEVRRALAHEREMTQAAQQAAAAAAAAGVLPAVAAREAEQMTPTEAPPTTSSSQPEEPAIITSQAGPVLISATQPSSSSTSTSLSSTPAASYTATSNASGRSTFLGLHKNILPASWHDLVEAEYWRAVGAELTNENTIVALRVRDVSIIALEGAAAGAAAAVGAVALTLMFASRF